MRRIFALVLTSVVLVVLGAAVMTSSAQDFGSNWTGQYFNDVNFTTPCHTRVDAAINFNFGAGGPAVGTCTNSDNFSIRWTGVQTFTVGGTYQFTGIADDSIRATIDGIEIMNVPFPQAAPTVVPVTLSAGAHTIIVEFKEVSQLALIQFQWSSATALTPTTVVTAGPSPTPAPSSTPTVTALPPIPPGAITATVIRASVLNVRDAPSLGGNRLGSILRGQTYAIVGRNEKATWFLLQLSGKQAWAWGYYLFINGNEFTPPVVSGSSIIGLAGQPDYGVTGQAKATVKLRAAPTVASAQIGRVTWGAFLPIVGRTADGFWWKVVWKNTVGWVYSPFFDVFQGDLNAVPIVAQ